MGNGLPRLDFKKGQCTRGISCFFCHPGIATDANRCYICGIAGHSTNECSAPGGGNDPQYETHWKEYRERRDKAAEKGKGKGNSDGRGNSDGKKGKRRGHGNQ